MKGSHVGIVHYQPYGQQGTQESPPRPHLMQNRLKKNGKLQLHEEPLGHSLQPKGSHIRGTAGLGLAFTG